MSESSGGVLAARYARQLSLLGIDGQKKLQQASVAVVGLGGLGSVSSTYLAAAGVGKLILIDHDVVSEDNLNRQILYSTSDIGRLKAKVAERRLRDLNPTISVEGVAERLSQENTESLLREADVVVDGLDSWESRLAVDCYAWESGKPFVHGAVERYYGQVTVISRGETGCLACITPVPLPPPACTSIVGPAAALVASIQAMEVIKILTGIGRPAKNRLVIINALAPSIDEIAIAPAKCEECRARLRASASLSASPQACP